MHFTVVGAGAMGSLMAARLTRGMQANDPNRNKVLSRVLLYGRESDHLNALRDHGLTLIERDGQHQQIRLDVTSNPADVAASDVVVVLVKSWATGEAMAPLKGLLTRDSIVITMQNGLGNASAIRNQLLEDGVRPHIWLGVTAQAAVRTEPGVVRHTADGMTAIGRRTPQMNDRLAQLAAAMNDAGWKTVAVADIHRWVWRKLAVNAAINPLTALARVPNGAITSNPDLKQAAASVLAEVAAVARAQEVNLNREQLNEAVEEVARVSAGVNSSMLDDMLLGRRTEIDAINGQVVRHARRHNIPVPVNDLLTRMVRASQHANESG